MTQNIEIYKEESLKNLVDEINENFRQIKGRIKLANRREANYIITTHRRVTHNLSPKDKDKRIEKIEARAEETNQILENISSLLHILQEYEVTTPSKYTFDIPEYVSKPGDIIVYAATDIIKIKHLVLENEPDFGIERIDVTTREGRRFLLLEKGQMFSEHICHNVLSKNDFIELIIEPDYKKNHAEVDLNDKLIIETENGFKYAVADKESGIIGTSIKQTGYYNHEKVKVIGAITAQTFYKRVKE